jgi:hypothetical protein
LFIKNESAAYNLHSIGAVEFFNALRSDLTPELERQVEQILENILSQQSTLFLSRSNSSNFILSIKLIISVLFSIMSIVKIE